MIILPMTGWIAAIRPQADFARRRLGFSGKLCGLAPRCLC
jgi:hypothetical protein